MNLIQPKYRFEILIPLYDNAGAPIAPEKIWGVFAEIFSKYGACRTQPLAPHLGWWVEEAESSTVYKDWTLMFAIDVDPTEENITWFRNLKQQLAATFNQLEIYIAGMEIFGV